MNVIFRAVAPGETDLLASFLASESWPFHANPVLSPEKTRDLIAHGVLFGPDQESFWIVLGEERIGLIRLFDLDDVDDGSPLFDIRLKRAHRGRGIGGTAVTWLTRHLFETYPTLERIAGVTRADNVAMRRVFRACGYVKEGHFRRSWPSPDGVSHDAVHYGILRGDWESNTRTAVDWDDEPK